METKLQELLFPAFLKWFVHLKNYIAENRQISGNEENNLKKSKKENITQKLCASGNKISKINFQRRRWNTDSNFYIVSKDLFLSLQVSRSLERQIKLNNFLSKEWVGYFLCQFGYNHLFNLYTSICGITLSSDCLVIDWRTMRDYLCTDYHHFDVLTGKLFKTKKPEVKVSICLNESEIETEFESPTRIENTKVFAKLVCQIVPRPYHGEQLMCYVKGDNYLTGILKYYFIKAVFTEARICVGSNLYSSIDYRLNSCRRLHDGFDASIDAFSIQLAEAGYFLTNDKKLAQCFKCGGILELKNYDFDPWVDHAYWHPSCPFLLESKGREFVADVREKLKEECDFDTPSVFTFKVRTLAPVRPYDNGANDSDTESSVEEEELDEVEYEYLSSASDYFSDFDDEGSED